MGGVFFQLSQDFRHTFHHKGFSLRLGQIGILPIKMIVFLQIEIRDVFPAVIKGIRKDYKKFRPGCQARGGWLKELQ